MANDELISRLSEVIDAAVGEATLELREDLDRVRAQFRAEDRGWLALFGQNPYSEDTGIDLGTLKDVSRKLREEVAGSPLPKQANELRYSYTFSQPFVIPGLENSSEVRQGRPSAEETSRRNLKSFYESSTAQRYCFGKEAHRLISTACSTDSMYVLIGQDSTKKVYPLPLSEITSLYVNPDFPSEIWAYQRTWTPNPGATNPETRKRWYFTDRFEDARPESIPSDREAPDRVVVEKGWTALDLSVGQQTGWVLGVPDLMAGQVWNQSYIKLVENGEAVSDALAFYAAKVKQKSKAGSDNVGVKVSRAGTRGNTVTYAEGNEVDVFSSAGKVADFEGLRPVAALYAASVGVSVLDLLASPTGSSYASASALTGGVRRGIESRRLLIASWFERVVKWATGSTIEITPASIEEVEQYRKAQVGILGWNSGLLHEDEVRPFLLSVSGMTPKHNTPPEGVLLPNNEKSIQRSDIDTDSSNTPATDAAGQNPTTSAPGQGVANGTGGAGSGARNDLRRDNVESVLSQMQNDEFLSRLSELVERMENAAK